MKILRKNDKEGRGAQILGLKSLKITFEKSLLKGGDSVGRPLRAAPRGENKGRAKPLHTHNRIRKRKDPHEEKNCHPFSNPREEEVQFTK